MSNLHLEDLSEVELSAFFHEYIHFLQDIMTTSGLFNIYVINEYFRLVATKYAIRDDFKLPIQIEDNTGNVLLNQYINMTMQGGNLGFDAPSIKIDDLRNVSKSCSLLVQNGINNLPVIEFLFCGKWLNFGALEIKESMAYILQRQCTKSYQSPDYPYMMAEKIAEFICPDFAKDIENVLALCDVSLLTDQPGAYFVNYIKQIQKGTIQIKQPEDIYEHFYGIVGKECNGKQVTSMQHYENLYHAAKVALKSYIAIPCLKYRLNRWIDLVFDTGLQIRNTDKYFFLKLARQGTDLLKNNLFAQYFNILGSPYIHNNKGEYGKFPSNPEIGDSLQYILAILPIFRTFTEGVMDINGQLIECYLKPFCVSSNQEINNDCITPWVKINDKKLCPVATIWKHRKLANTNIVI